MVICFTLSIAHALGRMATDLPRCLALIAPISDRFALATGGQHVAGKLRPVLITWLCWEKGELVGVWYAPMTSTLYPNVSVLFFLTLSDQMIGSIPKQFDPLAWVAVDWHRQGVPVPANPRPHVGPIRVPNPVGNVKPCWVWNRDFGEYISKADWQRLVGQGLAKNLDAEVHPNAQNTVRWDWRGTRE